MQPTPPSASPSAVPIPPLAARAQRPIRGEIITIALICIGCAVVAFVGGRVAANKAGKPTAEGRQVAKLQGQIDNTQGQVAVENNAQGKAGQQLAAATTGALAAAGPAAKADPAVQLAGKTAAAADNALALAMGPLTPDQQTWVAKLVADATSASVTRQLAADAALAAKSTELQASVDRERGLNTQLETLTGEKRTADQTLIEHDASASAFRANIRFWLFVLGGGYLVINYLLPLLVKSFPALSGIATAAHVVWSGLWAKTLAESKALATDASAALHSVTKIVETEAPAALAKVQAEAKEWITPADGTATRYAEALTKANVV